MPVVGYVRVSTENQLENYSIEEQTERLKSYCKAKGWMLLKIYTDGGYSGGNTDRPALRQMLADIKSGGFGTVVVYKLDRLSRSQKDTLTLIEDDFLKNNVDFVSINENFDTSTSFGRAMIGILSVFAQLEKDQITERFTMGRIGRGKAGYYHGGGSAPMGYIYENGELSINEYEAAQIRDVYGKFLSGKSINTIWHEMQLGYGGKWSAVKVRNILLNSVYIGKVKFAKVEYDGKHLPIVAEELFNEVQRLIRSEDREGKKNSAQKTPFRACFLLSSLIVCGRCGARYAGDHGYYKCYSRSKNSLKYVVDPNCDNDHWRIDELNDRVISAINDLWINKKLLAKTLDSGRAPKMPPDPAAVLKRIKDIDKQIERLVELYQIGSIPMESITQKITGLNLEKTYLTKELGTRDLGSMEKKELFLSTLNKFQESFADASLEAQRLLVSSLIETVCLDGDQISISWRL